MKKLIFALVFIFIFSFLAFGQETKEEAPYLEIYVEVICDGPWELTYGNLTGNPHGTKQGQGNYLYGPFDPEIYFGDFMVMLARSAPGSGQSPLVVSILTYTNMGLNVSSASTFEDYIFLAHNFWFGEPRPNRPKENNGNMPTEPEKSDDYDPRSYCTM